jgi:hypothetical protein
MEKTVDKEEAKVATFSVTKSFVLATGRCWTEIDFAHAVTQGEGEDVGYIVLASMFLVESPRAPFADESNRQLILFP